MPLKKYILLCLFAFATAYCHAQFTANAGPDKFICPGASTTIGGTPTATGGKAPYHYSWSPTTGLTGPTTANPTATLTGNTIYTVTVTDDTGAVRTNDMVVFVNAISAVNAGRDTSICENSSASIGSSFNTGGITYSWSPGATLNDSTSPMPVASPGVSSLTYTLTAVSSGCPPKTDQVRVTVIPTPDMSAGPDTTIEEGETAILIASGAAQYAWGVGPTITYPYSAECNVEPIVTTTYYLYGTDETGKCPAYDDVTVFVEPSDQVVIYNTFTPNGDGNNDTWYIGNIYKYPDNKLNVYNRYGKLVYKTTAYANNWDGKVYGDELPSGTYVYDLDLGSGNEKYHGTITIVR